MEKMEPYTIVAPEVQELRASDVAVGEIIVKDNTIFVQRIQQRVFVPDLLQGVTQHAKRLGYGIEYIIFDPEYDRFEFKLTTLPPVMVPRRFSDNPQA